jgi:hypothetical protein
MSTELSKYEAACKAVAEAHRVDEAKDIRDKHIAIQEYAKQSKNYELEKQATEIRLRAERKGGELLIEMKPIRNTGHGIDTSPPKKQKLNSDTAEKAEFPGGTPLFPKSQILPPVKPKLVDLGVDKKLSYQMQKLAKMPEDKFEEHIGAQKDKIDMRTYQQLRDEERKARAHIREVIGKPDFSAYSQAVYSTITHLEKHYALKLEKVIEHRGFLNNYMRKMITKALNDEAKKLNKWAEKLNEPLTIEELAKAKEGGPVIDISSSRHLNIIN